MKDLSEYFEVYDWLKGHSHDESPFSDLGLSQWLSGFLLHHVMFGVSPVYISRTAKRIRGIFFGWPISSYDEEGVEKIPVFDPKGDIFYYHDGVCLESARKNFEKMLEDFLGEFTSNYPEVTWVLRRAEKDGKVYYQKDPIFDLSRVSKDQESG